MWRFFQRENSSTKSKRQNQAEKGRFFRVWKYLVAGFAATLVLSVCLKWHSAQWLPINRVKILGAYEQVDKSALQQAITPYVSDGFWSVDVYTIKQAVERLPWVAKAVVRKRWPDTVEVRIKQHQAVTRWNQKGLISAKKQVFYPAAETISHSLPVIYGPEGSHQQAMLGFDEMQGILHPLGLGIKSARVDRRQSWSLELDNGIHLVLGQNDYQQRLRRFIRAYSHVVEAHQDDVAYIDLRYNNGMAVRWKKRPALI